MTLEHFRRYQEETFDTFCKKVIRNAAFSAHQQLDEKAEKETSLSDISEVELNLLHSVDVYRTYCKTFPVCGYLIQVYDPDLGEVLQRLTPQRRDVLLLGYFLGFNDYQIGRALHIDHKTVDYRRTEGLRRLRELLEDLEDA